MNLYNKLFKKKRTTKVQTLVKDPVTAPTPAPVVNHNTLMYFHSYNYKVIDTWSNSINTFSLIKLIPQNDKAQKGHYLIQMRYWGDQNIYTVRSIFDDDPEYAENCAREIFEYLTKTI